MLSDPPSPLRSARGRQSILRPGLPGCINNPALDRPHSVRRNLTLEQLSISLLNANLRRPSSLPATLRSLGRRHLVRRPKLAVRCHSAWNPDPTFARPRRLDSVWVLLRLGGLRPALTMSPQVSPLVSNAQSVAPNATGVNASEPINTCKDLTVMVITPGPGRPASYPQYHLRSFSG
jgi:hypothetical protein